MRVVFCDFDGVLNTSETWGRRPMPVDAERVGLLDRLCASAGAKVVISSTWRLLHPLDELRALLAGKGLQAEVIDATPAYLNSRADEIRCWLANHPEVTGYVVLDDYEDANVPGHFVQTDSRHGLTEGDVRLALRAFA